MPDRRIFLAALLIACSDSPAQPQIQLSGEGTPILFIGNSHTYHNDLPGVLQALADSGGQKIAVAAAVGANLALIDHWNGGTEDFIRSRTWTYVVMQQGWTPAGVCQDTLRLAARNFENAIRQTGATPALLQVWPPADRPGQWQGTIESYRYAAKDVNGLLFPAAEAWRAAIQGDSSLQLYTDGLHANVVGTYLNALVMYTRLFNRSPLGLPSTLQSRAGVRIEIPAALARTLQEIVESVALPPTPVEAAVAQPVITNRC